MKKRARTLKEKAAAKARRKPRESALSKLASQVTVLVRRHAVTVNATVEADRECGTSGGTSGDVLVRVSAGTHGQVRNATRWTIAEKLRDLADFVSHTQGDPMESAEIFLVMRRARKECDR